MARPPKPVSAAVTDPEDDHLRRLRRILLRARKDRDLTARDLAEILGVHENTVFSWERYDRHPAIDTYSRWAAALGYTLLVDLDTATGRGPRTPILLHTITAAQIARAADQLTQGDQLLVLTLVRRIAGGTPV